MKRKLKV